MEKFILISVGAVLGANARYWLGDWFGQRFGQRIPYGTFLINLSGSFLLGLFMTLAFERFQLDPRWRLLIAVGFLGAYTTFSTYTYESVDLLLQGQIASGLVHLFGSSILGLAAVGPGIWLGKVI